MFMTLSLKRSLQILTMAVIFSLINPAVSKDKLSVFDPNLPFESVMPFDGDVAFVKMNGKWTLIDIEGNILSKTEIDIVYNGSGDIFSVERGGKRGFMNRKGELIIDFQYTNCFAACSFSYGLGLLNIGGRYGYINDKNKFVINPHFDDAYSFRKEGFAVVKMEKKYGLIDRHGNYLIEPKFDLMPMFSFINLEDGLFPVFVKENSTTKTRYGFSDLKGNIRFFLDDKLDFSNNHHGFLNGYAIIDDFRSDKRKKRFINTSGSIVFDAYEDARFFKNGLAAVKINDRYGYIDLNGNFLIKPQFDDAKSFLDSGFAIVGVGLKNFRKWGIINRKGEYIINPQFDFIIHGTNDLFMVNIDGKWGLIDSLGNFILKPDFSDVWVYPNGIATIHKNGKAGYRRIF